MKNIYEDFLVQGKTVITNEWREGFPVFADDKAFVLNNTKVSFTEGFNENILNFVLQEVVPETIRKYTKLNDENNKKIFDGDIVRLTVFDHNGSDRQYTCLVIYNNLGIWFEDVTDENRFWFYATSNIDTESDVEIIGNKIDNPELLYKKINS